MKRLVSYELNFQSKWLTLSGIMMGFALFLQALDFFALGQFQNMNLWHWLLRLILPMTMEAFWCIPLRVEKWNKAEYHGVLASLICLILLCQALLFGGAFSILMAVIFYIIAGVTTVMITWGFVPHRALGMLVYAGTSVMQVLVFLLPRYVASPGYLSLIQSVPAICMTLSIMCFFYGIHIAEDK